MCFSLAAQGCVSVRQVYTGPSVTTAILDSSTSAAQDVNRANATTTLPTATLSQVSPAHFQRHLKGHKKPCLDNATDQLVFYLVTAICNCTLYQKYL